MPVNIWSTDSTNSTNKEKGRVQDSRQNCTATVLLISFFPYRIYFWVDFINFNKNLSKFVFPFLTTQTTNFHYNL